MKIAIITFLLLLAGLTYSQSKLSKTAIKDFANASEFQVRFNQNQNFFLAALMQDLRIKNGSLEKSYDLIISTETDTSARRKVFESFYEVSDKNKDKLYQNLFNWGLSGQSLKDVSDYISNKFTVVKTGTVKSKEEGEVSFDYTDNVIIDKKEKFFQGTKSFEGHIDDVYDVTITGNEIKITEPINSDSLIFKGIIKDGMILSSSGKESKFRYRNHRLYYYSQVDRWWLVFYELKD